MDIPLTEDARAAARLVANTIGDALATGFLPAVVMSLTSLVAHPEHEFLADSVSLLTGDVRRERLLSSAQVTDSYLLALAVASEARLVTFDTKLVTLAVPGGTDALLALT